MENDETFKTPAIETATEYIKLMKNTKGYNWELKILSLDINKLEKLNLEMINKFGAVI